MQASALTLRKRLDVEGLQCRECIVDEVVELSRRFKDLTSKHTFSMQYVPFALANISKMTFMEVVRNECLDGGIFALKVRYQWA